MSDFQNSSGKSLVVAVINLEIHQLKRHHSADCRSLLFLGLVEAAVLDAINRCKLRSYGLIYLSQIYVLQG